MSDNVPFPKAEGLLSIGAFLFKVDRGTLATYLLNLLPTALRGRLLGALRRKPAGQIAVRRCCCIMWSSWQLRHAALFTS
jgi:hypothetical protein